MLVATTAELCSLARSVGGEAIEASCLVPAGQDGESFQPRPQELKRLASAQVLVRVGVDFDLWLDKPLAEAGNASVRRGGPGYVDASSYIALLDVRAGGIGDDAGHAHGRGNPHYWLDPANAELITGSILEALARVDPANAKRYEANRLAFLVRLDAKIAEWSRLLAHAPALVAYHDTWPYFARRFRLHFVGAIEMRPGVPPSAAHMASLAREAREARVGAVIREPHEPERDAAFIARACGATVAVMASSVGAVPEAADYISLIDYDVRTLANLPARGDRMDHVGRP
ncbi:MAG TPA: metal ABC transporter substrate-binding protein [Usitatibacter sp.]|nr:metal ABC transporter substrate-binding protein [Usitatibacter sp.]